MKAQNETIEKIREMQVKNNDKFEDLNSDAYSKAFDEWNRSEEADELIEEMEQKGNFDWGDLYWELQDNMHGKLDFFTVTGLPPVEETELSEEEFEEVKDALHDLVSIWTDKLQEKVEKEME